MVIRVVGLEVVKLGLGFGQHLCGKVLGGEVRRLGLLGRDLAGEGSATARDLENVLPIVQV